jgi:transcriptional regulator with XRE-family HTH domain
MRLSKALQKFAELAKSKDTYWIERAKLDFSMALEIQRRSAGMTYSAIAKKIGTSAAYITKVFRGDANLTIESMVKLARSTGGRINIQVIDEHANAKRWASTMAALSHDAANQPHNRTATVVFLSEYAQDKEKLAA